MLEQRLKRLKPPEFAYTCSPVQLVSVPRGKELLAGFETPSVYPSYTGFIEVMSNPTSMLWRNFVSYS